MFSFKLFVQQKLLSSSNQTLLFWQKFLTETGKDNPEADSDMANLPYSKHSLAFALFFVL